MAGEPTFSKKIRQGGLGDESAVAIYENAGTQEHVHQRLGYDQIAKTQGGKDHPAESARVKDAPRSVHPLEGSEGTAVKAEFAVKIVLDDPGMIFFRPGQQVEAST